MVATVPVEVITFPNGAQMAVALAPATAPAAAIVAALGLPQPRALLVLNGGTARLDEPLAHRLRQHIGRALAQVVAEERITVITGGTDAGIFAIFGQGAARWGRTAPCVGVTVECLAQRPGHPDGEAPLEPHHSHFVLAEGAHWGAETALMYALAEELGRRCPSVALFAGGGEIVKQEMEANVAQGRPMILLAGSGRTTDAVLAARHAEAPGDPRLAAIARQGAIVPFDLHEEPAALQALIRRALFGQ